MKRLLAETAVRLWNIKPFYTDCTRGMVRAREGIVKLTRHTTSWTRDDVRRYEESAGELHFSCTVRLEAWLHPQGHPVVWTACTYKDILPKLLAPPPPPQKDAPLPIAMSEAKVTFWLGFGNRERLRYFMALNPEGAICRITPDSGCHDISPGGQ